VQSPGSAAALRKPIKSLSKKPQLNPAPPPSARLTCVDDTRRRASPASITSMSSREEEMLSTTVAPGTVTTPLGSFLISSFGTLYCGGEGAGGSGGGRGGVGGWVGEVALQLAAATRSQPPSATRQASPPLLLIPHPRRSPPSVPSLHPCTTPHQLVAPLVLSQQVGEVVAVQLQHVAGDAEGALACRGEGVAQGGARMCVCAEGGGAGAGRESGSWGTGRQEMQEELGSRQERLGSDAEAGRPASSIRNELHAMKHMH
jgi:hypothetical protein